MVKHSLRLFLVLGGVGILPMSGWAAPLASQDDAGMRSAQFNVPELKIEAASEIEKPSKEAKKQPKDVSRKNAAKVSRISFLRQPLAISDVQNMFHVSPWFVKAAASLQKHLQSRRLEILEYRFVDVNRDGKWDVAVIAQTMDSKKHQVLFGVYEFDEKNDPILRYERRQNIPPSEQSNYRQSLIYQGEQLGFCEDWKIASWDYHECHELEMDSTWLPHVSHYVVTASEPRSHASQTNVFDFRNHRAMRAYSQLPEGSFMPALYRESHYDMMFASYDGSLKAPTSLKTHHQSQFGGEHAPVGYQAAWNDDGLFLSMAVEDGDISEPEKCTDLLSVQYLDHVEVWIDLNPALNIQRDKPQSWQSEYETAYRHAPYRHDIDPDVMAFAVTSTGCVSPIHPVREHWPAMPQVKTTPIPGGYRVDMQIPASIYKAAKMSDLPRELGLGMTLRQHDIHPDGRFESVATSDWKWPDPFTFGQIWLISEPKIGLPKFPVQWSGWISGK